MARSQSNQCGIETTVKAWRLFPTPPLNRTNVELKLAQSHAQAPRAVALNRTNVELKPLNASSSMLAGRALNRTNVELKHSSQTKKHVLSVKGLSIEPMWN